MKRFPASANLKLYFIVTINLLATAVYWASNLILKFISIIFLKLHYLISNKKKIISKLALIVLTTLPLQSFATVNNNNFPHSETKQLCLYFAKTLLSW